MSNSYMEFKQLLRRFVEQANINIKGSEGKKTKLEGITEIYPAVIIDDIPYKIEIFNRGYGPKNGSGCNKLPYLGYKYSNSKNTWINIRTIFENFEVTGFKVVKWHPDGHDTDLNIQYLVKDLELDSEQEPNSALKQFYDTFVSFKKDNNVGENMMGKIYQLTITKDSIKANSSTFDINNLSIGDSFKPINVYFQNKTGEKIQRQYNKNERRNSNQTLPRLAFQIYEREIERLTKEERMNFPTCQYTPDSGIIKGIFDSIQEIKGYRNSIEFLVYESSTNYFVIYCWNIFSTLMFVQECLKRFGNEGDQFILEYKEKTQSEILEESHANPAIQDYVQRLKSSPNLILRGAPGTGKTYLARQIAEELTGGNNDQIGFVQFHPSYDYTDFVEGLRPVSSADGQIGFELQDGIFKEFCAKAKEDSDKNFVFIIDEINRGEISKIFGELFFAIDPSYRGEKGSVSTQYANLHETDERFYIPENVYIIGTMNDIDRSVDTFDFAMRRRFRFVEVKAEDRLEMLDDRLGDYAEEAKARLINLNNAISQADGLNSHYHIGPSYFLKLKDLDYDYDVLWSDYLEPLLEDYLRGSYDEVEKLKGLEEAYNLVVKEELDETDG